MQKWEDQFKDVLIEFVHCQQMLNLEMKCIVRSINEAADLITFGGLYRYTQLAETYSCLQMTDWHQTISLYLLLVCKSIFANTPRFVLTNKLLHHLSYQHDHIGIECCYRDRVHYHNVFIEPSFSSIGSVWLVFFKNYAAFLLLQL